MPTNTNNFADFLVVNNFLTASESRLLVNNAKNENISIINYLIIAKSLNYQVIAEQTAIFFGLKTIDLDAIDINELPTNLLDKKLMEQHKVLPITQENNILTLALTDPTNATLLNEIKFCTSLTIKPIIAEYDKLINMINLILYAGRYESLSNKDTHIIEIVDQILTDAINKHASDIHFELFAKNYRVRFRIDGILQKIIDLDPKLANRITARLKIIAKLNIAERRLPQDGRFNIIFDKSKATASSMAYNEDSITDIFSNNEKNNGQQRMDSKGEGSGYRLYDCRISICPTLHGEKIVIRILKSEGSLLTINELGLNEQQLQVFIKTIKRPQGMVLVTGPTGSGKTVSLYAALNELNKIDKNISTVEDPIEINLPGINQVNTQSKIGLDFVSVLRAFLRQDPDIIMVGEIRDLETAEISIKAAQTGHLVLSTLHANSAAESITRLLNMGITAFNLDGSLSLIIAQRLIRKLCSNCKHQQQISDKILLAEGFHDNDATGLTIYSPVGCEYCSNGFSGRIGIFEFLPISININKMIMQHKSSTEIFHQACEEGMISLRKHALEKVKQGLTCLSEINRIT